MLYMGSCVVVGVLCGSIMGMLIACTSRELVLRWAVSMVVYLIVWWMRVMRPPPLLFDGRSARSVV